MPPRGVSVSHGVIWNGTTSSQTFIKLHDQFESEEQFENCGSNYSFSCLHANKKLEPFRKFFGEIAPTVLGLLEIEAGYCKYNWILKETESRC